MKLGTIAFIGAGKMATAIAGGLVAKGKDRGEIKAYDISEAAREHFKAATGAAAFSSPEEVLASASIVVLAVKPQHVASALSKSKSLLKDKLFVSIAAGVKIGTLMEMTGCQRVVRVMPNTPALVGEGMSCLAGAPGISEGDIKIAESIFDAVGQSCLVHESQLDAVTGLSGSGPAYVLEFILGLADGGVYAGLPRDVAQRLAIQTVLGAAKMASLSKKHPGELRDEVISPAGTTSRGVMVLEEGAFKALAASAVVAAAERSSELAKIAEGK